MDNVTNKNDVLTDENDELALTAQQKIKKRIPLKVISTVFYSIITIAAFAFNVLLLVEAIATTNTVTEGWDGLGKAIGLAVIIYLTIIVGIVGVVLYQLPSCLSIVGLCTSFKKTKRGEIRGGKIYFSVLFAITVLSEILLAAITVGIILFIKFANG
jgi:hypothetical protein